MTKPKNVFLNLLLIIALLLPAYGQQPNSIEKLSERLAGSVMVGGQAMNYLQILSDDFGPRLTGSAAYQRSAEWAAAMFRAFGLESVRLEPFTIPNGWERGRATGRMIAPMEKPLPIEPLGWTPSTPPGGIKSFVVLVDDISDQAIKANSRLVKGNIVLLDLSRLFAEGFSAFARVIEAQKLLKEMGALAILWPDSEPNNVLNAFAPGWGAEVAPLPIAQIGMEDAKLIERLVKKGQGQKRSDGVMIEFQYENRVTGPIQVNNVIAELKGRENPDEWIIIGAHLDSWDFGTGAQDNGTGCAMVIEAARAITALGRPPRRSIRFALWGGEEQGLLGSMAYVKARADELGKCVAALNTDNGAGRPRGWKIQGREDVRQAMAPISKSLLAGLNGDGLSQQTTFDTDHGPFMLQGIPVFDLWVDMEGYGKVHHKPSDTIDKVDANSLATGAAVVAVTAYAIADNRDLIAPHQDRTAVEESLKKSGLYGFLKSIGVWN